MVGGCKVLNGMLEAIIALKRLLKMNFQHNFILTKLLHNWNSKVQLCHHTNNLNM
jgi:hypothetical protein